MSSELETATNECCVHIEAFIKDNKRYFGRIFNYRGTDFLESARKEVTEIKEIL